MSKLYPWEIAAELTENRLRTIADIMKSVRDRTVELNDPAEGDGPWSMGCRIYERTINVLQDRASSLPWLECRRDNLFFIMIVGSIPVRFYRGDLDHPTLRTLKPNFQEQLHFGFTDEEYRWRICVETDTDGSTLQIHIAQYNEDGDYQNPWEIPTADSVTQYTLIRNNLPQATEIPAPSVEEKATEISGEAVNE